MARALRAPPRRVSRHLSRLSGDHAARARGGRGDAALARRQVRQPAQPAQARPRGRRGGRGGARAGAGQRSGQAGTAPGKLYFTSGATEAANWALKGAARLPRAADRHARDRACLRARHGRMAGGAGASTSTSCRSSPTASSTSTLLASARHRRHRPRRRDAGQQRDRRDPAGRRHRRASPTPGARSSSATPSRASAGSRCRSPSCDMVALSAHKIHGPKGIGALWVRDGVALEPLLHGGGQEGGIRSGTLSPALCAGFGEAAAAARARLGSATMSSGSGPSPVDCDAGWTLNGSAEHRYRRQSQPPPRRRRRRPPDLRGARGRLLRRLGLRQRLGPAEPRPRRARPRRPRGALQHPPRLRPLHDRGGASHRARPDQRSGRAPAAMTLVRFISADGEHVQEVDAPRRRAAARRRPGRRPAARRHVRGADGLLDLPRHRRAPRISPSSPAPARRRRTCSISPPTSPAIRACPARSG